MTDALPDTDRALTFDERMAVAVEWSDYRKEYGVSAEGMTTAHLAFVAGWRARHLHGYTPESQPTVPADQVLPARSRHVGRGRSMTEKLMEGNDNG